MNEDVTAEELIEMLKQVPPKMVVGYWFDSGPRGAIARLTILRQVNFDPIECEWPETFAILSSNHEGPDDGDSSFLVEQVITPPSQ